MAPPAPPSASLRPLHASTASTPPAPRLSLKASPLPRHSLAMHNALSAGIASLAMSPPTPHHPHTAHSPGPAPHTCRASAPESVSSAESRAIPMRGVVEHVMLVKMPEDVPLETEQEMLDHVYTLQYHFRHVLSISLGRVFSPVSHGFTHAFVFRLPCPNTLAQFLAHPALLHVITHHVDPFCTGRLILSFHAPVEDDIDALFRRGQEFESGVEHLVLLRPKDSATAEQKERMLSAVRELPQKVGPTVVQLTAGETISSGDDSSVPSKFSHALIVRLPSEADLTSYNRHPAHREVIRKHLLPLAERILFVDFYVDPFGQDKQD